MVHHRAKRIVFVPAAILISLLIIANLLAACSRKPAKSPPKSPDTQKKGVPGLERAADGYRVHNQGIRKSVPDADGTSSKSARTKARGRTGPESGAAKARSWRGSFKRGAGSKARPSAIIPGSSRKRASSPTGRSWKRTLPGFTSSGMISRPKPRKTAPVPK